MRKPRSPKSRQFQLHNLAMLLVRARRFPIVICGINSGELNVISITEPEVHALAKYLTKASAYLKHKKEKGKK